MIQSFQTSDTIADIVIERVRPNEYTKSIVTPADDRLIVAFDERMNKTYILMVLIYVKDGDTDNKLVTNTWASGVLANGEEVLNK